MIYLRVVTCTKVVSQSSPSKFDFSRGDWKRTNKDLAIFVKLTVTFSLWLELRFGCRVRLSWKFWVRVRVRVRFLKFFEPFPVFSGKITFWSIGFVISLVQSALNTLNIWNDFCSSSINVLLNSNVKFFPCILQWASQTFLRVWAKICILTQLRPLLNLSGTYECLRNFERLNHCGNAHGLS